LRNIKINMGKVKIETGRLIIRTVKEEDAAGIYRYRSLPEVRKYQGCPKDLDEAKKQMAECARLAPNVPGTWYQFVVIEKSGGELIGDIAVHFTDGKQAELGYTLDPKFQKLGYATEAARAVLGWIFGTLKLHRVSCSADPRNETSIRVMKRMGMRFEGLFKKSYWTEEEGWTDDIIHALLKEEWENIDKA